MHFSASSLPPVLSDYPAGTSWKLVCGRMTETCPCTFSGSKAIQSRAGRVLNLKVVLELFTLVYRQKNMGRVQ